MKKLKISIFPRSVFSLLAAMVVLLFPFWAFPLSLGAQTCNFAPENTPPFAHRANGGCVVRDTALSPMNGVLKLGHALQQPFKDQAILPKWSADKLPFFCKIEHRWAKKHRMPLRFRLGSVDYVDWLEGKRR